jgi:hypothetical protein
VDLRRNTVSFIKVSAIAATILMLMPYAAQAQGANAEKKVDSTEKFREMDRQDQRSASVFDLPDIVLPTPSSAEAPKTAGVSSAEKAKTDNANDVTNLPIPMINLGISGTPAQKAAAGKYKAPNLPVQESVDASEFDIAGIFLGMQPKDAIAAALKYDFMLTDSVYTVPKFLEWKYKVVCEQEGHFILSEKSECVNDIANAKGERYISQITLEKPSLKEKIKVYFTSNFGKNLAYRIVYDAVGDYSLGTSAEPVFKKRERRKVFWRRLFTKYGWPSDYATMIWTAGFDKASLKVTARPSTASFRLVLEDMSITDADAYKMFKENQKIVPVNLFSF